MFGTAAMFGAALRRQVAAHTEGGVPPGSKVWPLDLQIAFPSLDGPKGLNHFARQGSIAVESLPGSCARVRYDGRPIPYLYIDPVVSSYDASFRTHILAPLLPEAERADALRGQAVDHVFPREQAIRDGIGFVLLLPCERGVNSAHGGGIERRMTGQAARPANVYRADWPTLMKMAGLRPPSIALGADLRAASANMARELARSFPGAVRDNEATRESIRIYMETVRDGWWGGR